MDERPFAVGDDVVQQPPYGRVPSRVCKVTRVTKTKVILDDLTEWSAANRCRWGSSADKFGRTRLQHVTEANRASMRRSIALNFLAAMKWDRLDTAALESVVVAATKTQIEAGKDSANG